MKYLSIALLLFSILTGVKAADLSETEVFYQNKSIKLSGVVLKNKMQDKQKSIGVVVIQGSGNSDRTNAWSYEFAAYLAESGFTVLLTDKRGCGKSEGSWKTASMSDLALDAIAGVEFLLNTSSMRVQKAGLLGLSQGGMIVPAAAVMSSRVSFVIDASGSAMSFKQTIIHEMLNTCRQQGFSAKQTSLVIQLHAAEDAYLKNGKFNPYLEVLAAMINNGMEQFANDFPKSEDHWIWNWAKMNIDYEPLTYWAKINVPALIIYGERDEFDNLPVSQSQFAIESLFMKKEKQDYELVIFSDTGHALYEKDRAKVRTDILQKMADWINQALKK